MRHFLKRYFFPLLLVLTTLLICFLNYTSGTWLTGWDTLHPEFNFPLSFKHIFFGVWRWDQGLGAVAAHSHMSELPRLLILWFFSLFSPVSVLRYLYVFLCFILGPLGVYVFLKRTILSEKTFAAGIAAFLGALFYIFNLGTVQQFFVPFEMFVAQYAALGWLFYFATEYMVYQRRKYLIPFAIVSFLASSMSYASLLWYAYLGGFILYLATICVIVKRKHLIRAAIILLITVFATNAYWILPNLYFLRNHALEVPNATTNILFSEEAFLHNKQYGNFMDAVVFKSFLFSWDEQAGPSLIFQHKILAEWNSHLVNPIISSIGYLMFVFVFCGVIVAFFDRTASRQTLKMAMFPLGLFALLIIINMNPPFSYLTDPLRDHFAVFREGLRFPWTKFSMLLMFAMSVYFALFWQWFFKQIDKSKIPVLIIISSLFIVYGWPMFRGEFIDKQLRINIPHEYFALFQWMNLQPENGRVAPLPMHSPWGWEYYDWGYQGSGFLWFGIKQPVLARDFDRWNPSNEQYYREMSTALYARDVKTVESLADKYQIRYFILDERVIFPNNKTNALWIPETKDIFSRSKRFHLVKQFGTINVYTFDLSTNVQSFVQTPSLVTSVGPQLSGGYEDQAMEDYPDYIESKEPAIVYPFRSLVDRYGQIDTKRFSISSASGYINLGKSFSGSPSAQWTSKSIYPSVATKEELSVEEKSKLVNDNGNLLLSFPITSSPMFLKDNTHVPQYCGEPDDPKGERKIVGDYVSFSNGGNIICDYVPFSASQDLGYLLIVESRNVYGLPMRLCVSSHVTKRCDLYTKLTTNKTWTKEIFVIPPYPTGPYDTSGIDVNFNAIAIGKAKNSNDIRTIQLIPFPYYRLKNLSYSTNNGLLMSENGLKVVENKEENGVSYTANLTNVRGDVQQGFFVLNQAYEDGWIAYTVDTSFPFIHPFINHVVFNSWKNGWIVPELQNKQFPMQVHFLFLPQLLEFAGFLVIPVFFIVIIIRKRTETN